MIIIIMNETYRKVLQIFVMKNYAALVAKLQRRNLPLIVSRLFCSVSIVQYTRVKLGVTGIISIWRWDKNATNVFTGHGCIFAIKHFFDKSLEPQRLLYVFCCKKFQDLVVEKIGHKLTDTVTGKLG